MILAILSFCSGLVLAVLTLLSAIRSFVLPRAAPDRLTRAVFLAIMLLFDLRLLWSRDYRARDRIMAMYAPICLLAVLVTWLTTTLAGYSLMFWGLGVRPISAAVSLSGSSLLTLGFELPQSLPLAYMAFSEAIIGLILVALLIGYLPAMYTAFARREAAVALLEVRAGAPPSAVKMLLRYQRIQGLDKLRDQWPEWEHWFVDIDESHTSLAPLVFFRSPEPGRSWVTAAGAVLDAAALAAALLDLPRDPHAELCIRSGYLALRHIAEFYGIRYDANPRFPACTISISRAEFDAACERLARGGLPLKPDREQAWRDFAGWRVNYDTVLLALAGLTMAPEAPWSSDRVQPAQRRFRPPLF